MEDSEIDRMVLEIKRSAKGQLKGSNFENAKKVFKDSDVEVAINQSPIVSLMVQEIFDVDDEMPRRIMYVGDHLFPREDEDLGILLLEPAKITKAVRLLYKKCQFQVNRYASDSEMSTFSFFLDYLDYQEFDSGDGKPSGFAMDAIYDIDFYENRVVVSKQGKKRIEYPSYSYEQLKEMELKTKH